MSDYLIGIDLGGTRIKAVAVTPQGHEYSRAHESTDDGDGIITWRGKVQLLIEGFTNQFGSPNAIGLSAPGLAARDAKSIAYMPGRLQGLENFDWSDYLQAPVRVLNDAHGALLGEAWLGAVAGKRNAFLLTLGTGVGGAILSEGQLLRGTIGRAGHLGHITMNPAGAPDIVNTPGSLEDAIGDSTVVARSDGKFTSTRDLVAAHQNGDDFASRVWLDSIRALAAGIASLINVLDPEAVVLGGGIMAAGDALLEPLRRFLDEMEWRPGGHRVPILPAVLGDYAGALGAASYAWQGADQSQ
jgi:glucokinase